MMEVEVLDDLSAVEALKPEWSNLADQVGARHAAHPFWCLAWWEHRGRGTLHVMTVRSEGRLVALAPLYREREMGIDVVRFMGAELLPVSEVLVARRQYAAAVALWQGIFRLPRCVLDLRHVRGGSPGLTMLRRSDGFDWTGELGPACLTVTLTGDPGSFRASLSSVVRRKLRGPRGDANRELPVEFVVIDDAAGLSASLTDAIEIYDAGEVANPRLHLFLPPWREYSMAMLHGAARENRFVGVILYVGGRPAGIALMIRSGDVLVGVGKRFNPEFSAWSPGHLLINRVVDVAFARKLTQIDFGIGEQEYKREWANGSYDTFRLRAWSSTKLRGAHLVAELAASSKQFRALEDRATYLPWHFGARVRQLRADQRTADQ